VLLLLLLLVRGMRGELWLLLHGAASCAILKLPLRLTLTAVALV
jgi:hypothetical protein